MFSFFLRGDAGMGNFIFFLKKNPAPAVTAEHPEEKLIRVFREETIQLAMQNKIQVHGKNQQFPGVRFLFQITYIKIKVIY
jgi:hypothetical protein